jgi:hypothetical protein
MLCLTEEAAKELKQNEIECNQLQQKYIQLTLDNNQAFLGAITGNPFVSLDQTKLLEEYNTLTEETQKLSQTNHELRLENHQLISNYNDLKIGSNLALFILGATYLYLLGKWIIKLERKMSKRDEPKLVIRSSPKPFPKKGDRK